jgi:hypothetical protein
MTNLIDCKYEENLVSRLEQISTELNTLAPTDISEDDIAILNFNTKLLNDELKKFRRLQNDLSKSKQITPTVKRKFKEQFVPKSIAKEFIQARIETAQDLTRYVITNSDEFRGSNVSSEDRILEALREIDPNEFRTFGSEFPSIELRLRSGPISSSEVGGLIRENGFDPRLFGSRLQQNRRGIFNLLERFLSALGIGIGIMGSFCALVENVYALSKGQRDISGNPAEFLQNFQNVLGLINPSAGEVIGQVQELIQLFQEAQSNTLNVANNLQGAIGLLASAFGIAMNFVNILDKITGNTDQSGSISVEWNLENIRDAISANDSRFLVIVPETDKPLGDINQDGTVTGDDAIALQTYIDGIPFTAVADYVDNIFIPFLNQNANTYSEFVDFPTAGDPNSNIGDLIDSFSSVAGKFGAGAGSGDFGLANIIQAISLAAGIISSIQSLVSGSKPVNIQGLFQQLDQVIELAGAAREGLFADFNAFSDDYKEETEKALEEAEDNAVDNSEKTAEISEKNQEALEENYTEALESTAEASKNLGSRVTEVVGRIRNGIRQLAAVGVLDQTADQLLSVIDQSAGQLQSKVRMFSPQSIDNGFHFNMGSSYAKMAGQIASAENAASDNTTEAMKDSVKGMIAQSSEKFQTKSKEEVEFVALRFCKLAGEIERMYKEVTAPIESTIREFQGIDRSLSGVGNETTLRAVRAGAIRYDTQTRLVAMQQAGTIDATITSPFVNAAGVRSITPGEGMKPSGFGAGPIPARPISYSNLPNYDDVSSGRGPIVYRGDRRGWRNDLLAFQDTLARLVELSRRWGQPITVTPNGAYEWRPNCDVSPQPCTRRSSGSFHRSGCAFDCSISGRANQLRFANLAYDLDFKGIGSYSSFIHIDTRGAEVSTWATANFNYYALPGPNGGKIG